MRTVLLLSHSSLTRRLVKLIARHRSMFEDHRLLSTAETGEILERETGLEVTHLFPARKGGDLQLCGLVCTNTIAAVIFLHDPLCTDPAEPDLAPFLRACDLNNVPLATNVVTAHAVASWLGRHGAAEASPPAASPAAPTSNTPETIQ